MRRVASCGGGRRTRSECSELSLQGAMSQMPIGVLFTCAVGLIALGTEQALPLSYQLYLQLNLDFFLFIFTPTSLVFYKETCQVRYQSSVLCNHVAS